MRRRRREESRGVDDESDYTHLKLSHFYLLTAALLLHHCLILHSPQFAPSIKGTMLTWSLYLFGLIITPISASADEAPVDLTDEPGSRLLHNGESYFIYPDRVWNY